MEEKIRTGCRPHEYISVINKIKEGHPLFEFKDELLKKIRSVYIELEINKETGDVRVCGFQL